MQIKLIDLINSLTLDMQPDLTHKPAGNTLKKNTQIPLQLTDKESDITLLNDRWQHLF